MNKEFIPYEQALALKELGFDEPCFGYWNIDPYLPNPTFNLVKPFDHEWCIPAPLYQQVFRWFREKHCKLGCIQKAIDRNRFVYLIDDIIFGFYDTYEEAELACINKLIELVKSKI